MLPDAPEASTLLVFFAGVFAGGMLMAALAVAYLDRRSVAHPQPRQDAPDDNANRLEAAARFGMEG